MSVSRPHLAAETHSRQSQREHPPPPTHPPHTGSGTTLFLGAGEQLNQGHNGRGHPYGFARDNVRGGDLTREAAAGVGDSLT